MELSVKGITKSYTKAEDRAVTTVLKDLSLTVHGGRIVCVVGPSGCGKTTLLRIIAGLDRPDTGSVLLDDKPLKAPSTEIGFVFQEPALFPWRTVRQNIAFGLEIAGVDRRLLRTTVDEAIELVELSGFGDHYPKELSGGMKQKAALAMSLVMRPPILLLDEPFVALDSQTRNHLQEVLLHALEKRRCTAIFVTHNVDEAVFLADEVFCMTPRPSTVGRIVPVEAFRPRDRTGAELNSLRREILAFLSAYRAETPA